MSGLYGPSIPDGADLKYAWDRILSGEYQSYLQPKDEITHYLRENVERYGVERVPFAGPECGLGPWDWKHGTEMALANLSQMSSVVQEFNRQQ